MQTRGNRVILIGEEFVKRVINSLMNMNVNIIKEYVKNGRKFDIILTYPKMKGVDKIIHGKERSLANKLIKSAKSIIIIECSKPGHRLKYIKANFGEVLKLAVLDQDVLKKIRAFILVHERLGNRVYKLYVEKLNKVLSPNFKMILLEYGEVKHRIAEIIKES